MSMLRQLFAIQPLILLFVTNGSAFMVDKFKQKTTSASRRSK